MDRKSGAGFLRDSAGSLSRCSYVISIDDEREILATVNGVEETRSISTTIGGLVLSVENLAALDLASKLTLVLEDGSEIAINASFAPEEIERPVLFDALGDPSRPGPKR